MSAVSSDPLPPSANGHPSAASFPPPERVIDARRGQTNPYLAGTGPDYNAARTYSNDRYLQPAANARNWRLAFFALLCCCAGLTTGLVVVTTRQQVVPYIVEVDEAGAARAIKELLPPPPLQPLVLKAVLTRWVQDIRTLTTDQYATRWQTNQAYQMCLEPAQKVVAAYYHENPPDEVLKRGRVFPVKITVAPVAGRTWRARWQEQLLDSDGHVIEEVGWEATFEVALVNAAQQKHEERVRSPLGIWIATLQWTPV